MSFRLGRWKCYMLMLVEQAPWLSRILAVVAVGLAVAGFIISPWVGIAALGIDVFLIVMAMSFVIMAYGICSVTGVNMAMHTLEIGEGEIRAVFEDGKTIGISLEEVRPYKIYPGGILIPVDGKKAGWIWVPAKAFDTAEEFQSFIRDIYRQEIALQQ